MKNKGKMRILALVLCMVVMLSNSSFIFASGETETAAAAPETTEVTPEPEVSAASELAELPTPEPTAEPTPEASAAPEPTEVPTPEASAAPEPTEEPTPEASAAPEPTAEPTPEASAAPEPTEVPTPEVSAVPEPTEIPTSEPTPEASAAPTPAAEQDIGSEESAAVTPTPEAEPEPDGSSEEIVLEGSCGDTTVILSGPASSFPEGTELSILVQEPAEEDQEVIEEAVEKQAEEQEMEVKSYTALDIRLLSNGEEIQPLGPVSVKFQQPEQQERIAEETSTQVLHVDESTGDATDMEAEVTEDGEVAIETTHFSIYVVVDLNRLGGEIELTVQHWAQVDQLADVDGTGTDGLKVDGNGGNNISGDSQASLKTESVFTEIYSADTLTLENTRKITIKELSKVYQANVNKDIKNYNLTSVWVLRPEGNPNAVISNVNDTLEIEKNWTIYSIPSDEENQESDEENQEVKIELTGDSVIRMIYTPVSQADALQQSVKFWDYNVTNGNGSSTFSSDNQGINSSGNYPSGSDRNKRIAVGQASNGIYHDYAKAEVRAGERINMTWHSDQETSGMVETVNEDGPVYKKGLTDPGLFNDDDDVTGKHIVQGYELSFNQDGDTYTLSSVRNQDGKDTIDNLEQFTDIYDNKPDWSDTHKTIYSNNFWPLDELDYSGRDILLGQEGVDYYITGRRFNTAKDNNGNVYDRYEEYQYNAKTTLLSDDMKPHNWFFGMRYDFDFTLGDYTGPLNYYFRGDDDFWLFIDGKLAIDLGGIHSAVGKSLDLKNFMQENGMTDPDETHRLTIIYAERGGSGSTCYMQFTIPNVTPVDIETTVEKTNVTVHKNWEDHGNPNRPTSIKVQLYYKGPEDEEWKAAETDGIKTLTEGNQWTATWIGLPKENYQYKVKEVDVPDHYEVIYPNEGDGVYLPTDDGSYEGEFTNKANPSTWITVTKQWDDGELESQARPEKVDFYLYYRKTNSTEWLPYPTNGRLSLTANNAEENSVDIWQGVYEDLPVYDADGKKLEYTVKEVNGDTELAEGATLPGKDSYQYTVHYLSVDHYKNGTWKAYTAEENKETLHLTVENSLGMEIRVTKEWKGHAPAENAVVYVGLYKQQQPVTDKWVKLEADNWTDSFEYLTPATDYSVKELRQVKDEASAEFTIGGTGYVGVNSGEETTVGDGDSAIKYVVSYSQLTKDVSDENLSTITITNQAQWQLIKYSSSSTDKSYTLRGAKFELEDSEGRVYTGESDQNGVVQWENNPFTDGFPDDIYTLTETAAPTGYALGDSVTFEMKDGVPVKMNGENAIIKDGILTFYYANEAIYSLPSSGSNGIYGYLSSGTLLLMAGTLILYKMKRKEVQES